MERLIRAFYCSLKGLSQAWKDERAFREEVVVLAFGLPLAFYLAPGRAELALMGASLLLLLCVELLNSGIEAAIDRIGPEIHPLSGKAKDVGSAAVLVASVLAAFVWAVCLWP